MLANTDLALSAIGTDYHGEILLADRAGGALYYLDLPAIWDASWIAVDERMGELLLQADRVGYSKAQEQLDIILRSRRYQLGELIGDIYQWLRSPF